MIAEYDYICIIYSMKLRFASLLVICSSFSCAENVNIDSIGKTVDESSLYGKDNPNNQSSAQKGIDALSALKNIDDCKSKKTGKKITPKEKKSEKGKDSADKKTNKKQKVTEFSKDFFVVAKANSEVITNVDIINAIKFVFFSSGKKYNKQDAKLMEDAIINAMIDDKLQQQYAKMYSIKVSDAEVDAKIADIAKSNGITVDELGEKFEELGISMDMFKKNMKSRMLLQFIIQIVGETGKVTDQELKEAKAKSENDIKEKRYHLCEIFFRVDDKNDAQKIKENAEAVLKLLKDGFSFQVMAETLSQGTYSKTVGDLGWIREQSIEKPVLDIVKNLKFRQFSEVIETRTGYKIVYVLDKAEPGKQGQENASYKVISSKLKYKGGIVTQKDTQRVNEIVGSIVEADSSSKFKEICKQNKLEVTDNEIVSPDDYQMEMIKQSKESGKPVIMQSTDDEDSVNILFLVSEEIPNATIPEDKALFEKISAEKIQKEFARNFKKMKATAHTEIYNDKLKMVF